MATVGILGDYHAPYNISGYGQFYADVCEAWNVDTFVSIGDIVDLHACSFHAKEHGHEDLSKELAEAKEDIANLYKMFPEMKVCMGNHDALIQRQAASVGLTEDLLVPVNEVLGVPNWEFGKRYGDFEIDGVLYRHGDQNPGGEHGCMKAALEWNQSMVSGHTHRSCSVQWKHTRGDNRIFAMQVGCGVDYASATQNYGRNFKHRPFISVGIVVDGERPFIEMMPKGVYEGF